MRDFTSSRSEKKKQPQPTIHERNRIDLILDTDPASETLNPHMRTRLRVRADKKNDDSSQDMTQSLPPPPPAPAPLPALTTCAISCQRCLKMCTFAAWLPCAHTRTHIHTCIILSRRALLFFFAAYVHVHVQKNTYTSGARACWCACAPAKAKRPIAQYMPDLSLAQGWSGAQSMLAGALLLGVCSRKNKQTHGATDA